MIKRTLVIAALASCLPTIAEAAICRHNGGWFPASAYSPCPECEVEGKIPDGYKWYNAHLAPSGEPPVQDQPTGRPQTVQISNSWEHSPYEQKVYVPYSYPYWPPYMYQRYGYVSSRYASK